MMTRSAVLRRGGVAFVVAAVVVLAGCAQRRAVDMAPDDASAQTNEPSPNPGTTTGSPNAQCQATPATATTAESPNAASTIIALAPGIRVDRERREVLVDASVPIDVGGAERRVFLEVLLCTRNSREHETLLVTDVRASLVHAGLLMIGLEPGSVGSWAFEGTKAVGTPATGAAVEVLVRWEKGGVNVEEPLAGWVMDVGGGGSRRLIERYADAGWVFAGSRFRRGADGGESNVYEADAEGTIVGLTTFGHETIGWTVMHHPDTSVQTPVFVADAARTPAMGTKIVAVVRAAK